MAKQATRTELSSPDSNDEPSLASENQQERPPNVGNKRDSIKNYVTNVLHNYGVDDENVTQTQIRIDTLPNTRRNYENVSAFRQYQSSAERPVRTDAQQRRDGDTTTDDDELIDQSSATQVNIILNQLYLIFIYLF
jgi:hypothetical protein